MNHSATRTAEVQCPYCFEWVEIALDIETQGELVQDCEVCCRPWHMVVSWEQLDGDLVPGVFVARAQ